MTAVIALLPAGLDGLVSTPLFGLTLTVTAFWAARLLWRVTGRRAAANPVLVAIIVVATVLLVGRIPYERYLAGARFIDFLLGPATVALALPLHRNFDRIRRAAPMILGGVTAGCVSALAAGYWLTRLLGGTEQMARSMAPKSATTPISIALSTQLGGVPALSAVFTITAGVVGAVAAPALLDVLRVKDRRIRGLAMGVVSHGIGTARALEDDETEGAFSGLAMGLNGLATSLVVGVLVQFLGR